jgi:hypothetical protein
MHFAIHLVSVCGAKKQLQQKLHACDDPVLWALITEFLTVIA